MEYGAVLRRFWRLHCSHRIQRDVLASLSRYLIHPMRSVEQTRNCKRVSEVAGSALRLLQGRHGQDCGCGHGQGAAKGLRHGRGGHAGLVSIPWESDTYAEDQLMLLAPVAKRVFVRPDGVEASGSGWHHLLPASAVCLHGHGGGGPPAGVRVHGGGGPPGGVHVHVLPKV